MKLNRSARERLIFALDLGDNLEDALDLVSTLKDDVGVFKIGKEAFTRFGPSLVEETASRGGRIFLDLKFHDIPNTVARATEAALRMPLSMFTIHASGGTAMMRETVAAAHEASKEKGVEPPLILAVTVLTSLNDSDVAALGFSMTTNDLVTRLALLAQKAGVSGVVASPGDIPSIREACGKDFIVVTPGIRLKTSQVAGDDQKRTLTPKQAITEGADFIVVGRPIRTATDPAAAARGIVDEIEQGLTERTNQRH